MEQRAGRLHALAGQEENPSLLAQTIGLQLELEAQQKRVGPFSADILCRNVDEEDHWVLTENQLEMTDHRRLGQILTYAAWPQSRSDCLGRRLLHGRAPLGPRLAQ